MNRKIYVWYIYTYSEIHINPEGIMLQLKELIFWAKSM